ncbi:MAG: hypothetical protein AAF270_07865 [Pseudomonadota bacterium]
MITLAILAGCTSEPANRQAGSAGDVAAANGPDDTRNASPNAAVGCAASVPIVLRGELHGAVRGELVATSATTHCQGMQRPARNGVRLQFRIAKGEQISNLTMIVGIDKLGRGDVGEGLRTTLTIIDEDNDRFFSTGEQLSCFSDITENRPRPAANSSAISGIVWCTAAIPQINGNESVRLSELYFSGIVEWRDELS